MVRRAHYAEANNRKQQLRAGAPATLKCPTRIITYGWGDRYVDFLLTFTLPALLAPGNLPYVASEVPCELVILTQRRYSPCSNATRRSHASENFVPFALFDSTI